MRTRLEASVIDELSNGGRLLVSRFQFLGDIVLSIPILRIVRERYPRAEIDYLARGPGVELLESEPVLTNVFALPEKKDGVGAVWNLARMLRSRHYAASVDLYSNPRSALWSWVSGARLRIGGDRRMRRHLYTHPVRVRAGLRAVTDHYLEYVRPLDVTGPVSRPTITLTGDERARGAGVLEDIGVSSAVPVVGLHPGGKWEVKRWPVDQFAGLAGRLSDRGIQTVVLVGPGEERYRDALRDRIGERSLYLETLPLRTTAAVCSALDGMVVADGGIMHLSVAVGTPTVGIFGSAEPDVWFPYEEFGPFVPAFVPITCRPCHSHHCGHISCLWKLTPAMVEDKLLAVMNTAGATSRKAGL